MDLGSRGARTLAALFPWAYAVAYAAIAFWVQARGGGLAVGDLDMETDFYGDLLLAAKNLVEGRFSVHDYPYKGPLYPALLAGVHAVAGDWFRAAVLLNAVAAGAALLLAYFIFARLFDRTVAAVTMVLSSLVVDFFVHAHHATTDVVFLCLAAGAIAIVLRACAAGAEGGRRWAAVAGAVAGGAFLTRYHGAFLLAAAVVTFLFVDPARSPRAVRWQRAVAWLIGFALVVAPWVGLNLRQAGRILPGGNVQNVAAGLFAEPRLDMTPIADAGDLAAAVERDRGAAVVRLGRNWAGHFRADLERLLGWPGAVVALFGLAGLVLAPPSRALVAYLVFPLAAFLSLGIVFYAPRFSFVLVPAYYGLGVAFLLGRRPRRRRIDAFLARRTTRIALAILGVTLVAVQAVRIASVEAGYAGRRPTGLRAAATALANHAAQPAATVLMARKGHLAHLAGMRYQPYPRAATRSLAQLLEFADAHDVQYIAYGTPEHVLCPDLRFLRVLDAVPGLRLIHDSPSLRLFVREAGAADSLALAEGEETMLRANLADALHRGAVDLEVRARGDLATARLRRGDLEGALGELRAAVATADRAVATGVHVAVMRRNAAVGRNRLAHVLLRAGRPVEALPLALEYLAYAEEDGDRRVVARAHLFAGRCYTALGREAEAAAAVQRARSLVPGIDAGTP